MLQKTLHYFRNLTTNRIFSAILDFDKNLAVLLNLKQVVAGIKYTDIITIQY